MLEIKLKQIRVGKLIRLISPILASAMLYSCGGGTNFSENNIKANKPVSGVTPFISYIDLEGARVNQLSTIQYTIMPKASAVTKAAKVKYSLQSLHKRNFVNVDRNIVTLPIFGLYSGYNNHIKILLTFDDASTQDLDIDIPTATYADPREIFDRPIIVKNRASDSEVGIDYFTLLNNYGSPIIMDSDGEIRWITEGLTNSYPTIFQNNSFIVGGANRSLMTLQFDGSSTRSIVRSSSLTNIHHEISPGKNGILIQVDAINDDLTDVESTIAEINSSGEVLEEWDFAKIISEYMISQGDDPALFVRRGVDWFHSNSVLYDSRDDSLIVSSRENFIIKVGYSSKNIIWILGDPTKYWYSFPSLQRKAITLIGNGIYPIGQHALSVLSDGQLMLFNNGGPSFNQPTNAPSGESRTYSAVSSYLIDDESKTAVETTVFDKDRSILSDICSSAYYTHDNSLLVTFSAASNRAKMILVGIDKSKNIAFEFEFSSPTPCAASWNTTPFIFDLNI